MTRITRGWDRAGYGGMRNDPFQKELRPGMTIEFRGPFRQRLLAHPCKKIAAAKWTIHNDCNPAISSDWQNLFLSLAFKNRVIDLDALELLRAKEFRYFTVGTGIVMSAS